MNKVNRIYWTQREWELVWAEFTRLPAVNPQMVEREDLIVNAMMVLPKERQPTLDTPARNRLFRLLSSKSWKVHPSSAKQAAKDAKEQQVQAEVKKALEGSEWSTKDPLPNLKRDPAVSLDVLLQNLEGINAEILRAKEEEAKKDLTIVRLFDENKALKDEVQRLKTVNPIAEAILHVEARFAGMQNDLFHRLTAWMETRLPQTPAQVTEKTLTAALSPAPVSAPAPQLNGTWKVKHDPTPSPSPKARKKVLISGLVPSMLDHYTKELPGVDITLLLPDKLPSGTPGEFDLILHVLNGVCSHKSLDYLTSAYGRGKIQFVKKGQNRIVSAVKSSFRMA